MIARQRQNLGLSFAATEQQQFSPPLRERVARNETELLDATQEFTAGWEARTGPSPDLQAAIAAMQSALDQLSRNDAPGAVAGQREALAALIRARQNIRQKLSQSSSSSSACRTFDRQQQQRLRKPEDLKQDQNQQLSDCRQNLEQLAQQQRQWSEDVQGGRKPQLDREPTEQQASADARASSPAPKPGEAASGTSAASASSTAPASAEPLGERQQELIDAWENARDRLNSLAPSTDATDAQADEIARSMQRGLNAQQRGEQQTAAEAGTAAAEMLDELADHLATWQSQDVLERLSQAHEFAERLAQRERELGEDLAAQAGSDSSSPEEADPSNSAQRAAPGVDGNSVRLESLTAAERVALSGRQQGLAAQAGLLAEQLDRLRGEAAVSDPRAAAALQQLDQQHAPQGIALEMSAAARDISQGHGRSLSSVQAAQQRLEELASGLRGTRADLGQPRLEELLALEEDLARAIDRLESQPASGSLAASEQTELTDRLAAFAASDRRLQEALNGEAGQESSANPASDSPSQASPSSASGNSDGTPSSHTPNGREEVRPGFYSRSAWMTPGRLRQANQVVQLKIQEIILAGAQMDGDAPVPAEYAPLVEEYYRQLSDDLR